MSPKLFGRTFFYALSVMLATSLLSAATYYVPAAYTAVFLLLVAGMAVLVAVRLDLALLVLFGELLVGSQGHIFAVTISGFSLSIRLAFFLLVTAALAIRLLRQHRIRDIATQPGHVWLLALVGVILASALHGLLRGNALSNVFFDANGFLFLGLAVVLIPQLRELVRLEQLAQVFLAGLTFLAAQALVLLAVFSHQYDIDAPLYRWLRNTRTVEVTAYAKNFYRVFSQSQMYSMFGFFFAVAALPFVWALRNVRSVLLFVLAVTAATLLLSFSRSLWAAWLLAGLAVLVLFLWRFGFRWKTAGAAVAIGAGLLLADLVVISFVANYPYLWNRPGGETTLSLLSDRGTGSDFAAASRVDQIQPLLGAIAKNPVIGSGFGTTVTYRTHDPRIVAATGGVRTTFAFELGYLDLLLKIGILGVAVLFGWILVLARSLWQRFRTSTATHERVLFLGLFLSVLALLITHATTPYLNHPLGLGLLTLAAGLGLRERESAA